jgi:hypothetical protein
MIYMEKGPEVIESTVQTKIESIIGKVNSIDELALMLDGLALGVPTLHDPETGNNLDTSRVANALRSGHSSVLADECPIWMNRALHQAGLIGK